MYAINGICASVWFEICILAFKVCFDAMTRAHIDEWLLRWMDGWMGWIEGWLDGWVVVDP